LNAPPEGEWYCPRCAQDNGSSSEDDDGDDISCEACASKESAQSNAMLLCDGDECSAGWHIGCLPNKLLCVPPGAWLCPDCSLIQRLIYMSTSVRFEYFCLCCIFMYSNFLRIRIHGWLIHNLDRTEPHINPTLHKHRQTRRFCALKPPSRRYLERSIFHLPYSAVEK
jgi:hypothetical protein